MSIAAIECQELTLPRDFNPARDKNGVDDELRSQVWSLLSHLNPARGSGERRYDQRFPLGQLVVLSPIDRDGNVGRETLIVAGKHLSERGLGFYHPQPLAHRRVVASLEVRPAQWIAFLMDLKWCRFTQHGWYESGGRFLQAVPSPFSLVKEAAGNIAN